MDEGCSRAPRIPEMPKPWDTAEKSYRSQLESRESTCATGFGAGGLDLPKPAGVEMMPSQALGSRIAQ